ncbi:MAG: hypothetical protein DI630_15585 [Gordonia sp. (in: high G+C Gram-positive bacteria)]|nr:MAG: hypothetical protein DI630_15585 [Gordonia sp. (in: high G+C Gram-positive bacteria)]
MTIMRLTGFVVALIATLLIASCSSDDESTSSSPTSTSPTSTTAGRGATVGQIGKPAQRVDGAYKITLISVVDPGVCDTENTARPPSDTGDRLLVATFVFETSNIPLDGAYLATTNFYSVTDQTVRATQNVEDQYQCGVNSEGQTATNNPLPNAQILRTGIFRVPVQAQLLGYRDPDTRQAFEWDITGIPTAPSQEPAVAPPPETAQPTTATPPPEEPDPAPEPVVIPPATTVAPDLDSCVEGTTRYHENSGITYTCRDGSWHEGPYN